MQNGTSLNGAGSAAVGILTTARRYRPETTAANAAGLWQVRDQQSGLRRWLRYLGSGPDGQAAAALLKTVHGLVGDQPWMLALERTDEVDGEAVALYRWLAETPLTSDIAAAGPLYYALQLLDGMQGLLTRGIALPSFDPAQLMAVANARRLRLSNLAGAQADAAPAALTASRMACRRALDSLLPENSSASRYTDLASAWENDAAVYPELRLALAQLQYGQLLSL